MRGGSFAEAFKILFEWLQGMMFRTEHTHAHIHTHTRARTCARRVVKENGKRIVHKDFMKDKHFTHTHTHTHTHTNEANKGGKNTN